MTSNQKKALKAEHTNRLKNAFVKALQQEQASTGPAARSGAAWSSSLGARAPSCPSLRAAPAAQLSQRSVGVPRA